MNFPLPGRVPIWAPGKEPLPPGLTEDDRTYYEESKRWEGYTTMAMESCALKTTMAGGVGTYEKKSFSLPPLPPSPKRKKETKR
jgi:mitochondrial import inner membrane translocase subunit TIM22